MFDSLFADINDRFNGLSWWLMHLTICHIWHIVNLLERFDIKTALNNTENATMKMARKTDKGKERGHILNNKH
jgi:hypothetical protein